MTSPVKIGDIVADKYRIETVIGEGGMGIVFSATHLELDQRVALKFLLPEAFADLEAAQRFQREARAAAKIKSEHVARIIDTGRHEGAPFQVMELLVGEDLGKVLATRGAVAVEDAVSYVLQASEALAEAHAAGIVHRDLKPANLFLAQRPDRTRILKVLDFGISKNLLSGEKGLTRSNAIVGSPFYMSPEQLTFGRDVDTRTDIWSLGIILYELISGTTPFNGDTLPQVVAGILLNKPRMVGEYRPGLPPPLLAAVARCMKTEPSERFASVAELASAIAPFGPPGARESAERTARVLHVSYPPEFAPTMAEGADGSASARSLAPGRFSGTAAPWSRTGASGSASNAATGSAAGSSARKKLWAASLAAGTVLALVAGIAAVRSHPSPSSIAPGAQGDFDGAAPGQTLAAPVAPVTPVTPAADADGDGDAGAFHAASPVVVQAGASAPSDAGSRAPVIEGERSRAAGGRAPASALTKDTRIPLSDLK